MAKSTNEKQCLHWTTTLVSLIILDSVSLMLVRSSHVNQTSSSPDTLYPDMSVPYQHISRIQKHHSIFELWLPCIWLCNMILTRTQYHSI